MRNTNNDQSIAAIFLNKILGPKCVKINLPLVIPSTVIFR